MKQGLIHLQKQDLLFSILTLQTAPQIPFCHTWEKCN